MIRIFGGAFKGRELSVPKGSTTRPSSGMLRQALFNICQGMTDGADILDLFAGSGAVGLEALSRGARSATFVEKENLPFKSLKKNIDTLQCSDQATAFQGDVFSLLPLLAQKGYKFDLIFADPPYLQEKKGKLYSVQLLEDMAALNLLKPGAFLFIEEGGEIAFPPLLTALPQRRYGRTYLYTFQA